MFSFHVTIKCLLLKSRQSNRQNIKSLLLFVKSQFNIVYRSTKITRSHGKTSFVSLLQVRSINKTLYTYTYKSSARVTRQVPLMEQELFLFPDPLRSRTDVGGFRVELSVQCLNSFVCLFSPFSLVIELFTLFRFTTSEHH